MPRSDRTTASPPSLQTWHWFVLAAAVPLIHCASRLNLDLWHDEIFTVDYFVRRGPAFIVSDYSLPNNHVLYSLVLWPFYCVSDSNFVLRLPSLLFTLGTLVIVFRLARRLRGTTCAVLSTALLGLNQMFLIFTIQVRGYSLSMFLTAWLASLALAVGTTVGWRRSAAIALVGAALLYALPTNALFFAPLAVVAAVAARRRRASGQRCRTRAALRYFRWLGQKLAESNPEVTNGPSASDAPVVALPGHRGGGALSRERAERAALPQPPLFVSTTAACRIAREAVGWLSGGALALACYLPIFGQVRNAARSASPSSWSYLPVIAGNFFRPATHDLIWFAPLFLAGLATWMLPRRDGQPRHWVVPALTVAVAVGAFLTTGLLRISPFERNYCPLLVFLALAEGWLLTELIEAVHARWLNRWPREAATALGLAAVSLPLWPMLWTYPQRLEVRRAKVGPSAEAPLADGYYCYYAANYRPSAVVQHLLAAGVERSAYRVCFTKADHHNLVYYFARSGLPPFAGFEQGEPAAGRVALFAVAPKPPPWQRLAHDCGLAPEQIDTFEPVGDFGYYWLWEQH